MPKLELGYLCKRFSTINCWLQRNKQHRYHITAEMRDLILGPSAGSMSSQDQFWKFHELGMQRVNLDRMRTQILIVADYIDAEWKHLTL